MKSGIPDKPDDPPALHTELIRCWITPGTSQIAGTQGSRKLTDDQRDEISERTKALHAQGKMKRSTVGSSMSNQSIRSFTLAILCHLRCFTHLDGRSAILAVLTYGNAFPHPKASKTHLDALGKAFTRRYPTGVLVWAMEAQKRLAPHFNLLVSLATHDPHFNDWLRETWFRITGTGGSPVSARLERCVLTTELYDTAGAVNYVAQELGKRQQKEFAPGTHPGR